ncbi:hypothetical protein A3F07_01965 [candidate division WWE3 bacterium RIFCSPHIGHO2_12_FULL_38_15]|uniref:Glycerophosphoryl diester phosphodiesterase membrane domain-containing protein n=1 Tax=candidate division WWE3 bacterium RIFCSPHIGHO2_02_FULL_38_14 TaxID=1802620 RepID=A0A1F4V8C4_UNCKA|nr:MAG: hypothetical protein A2793_03200 [candidate division WWE3 bacterium RIFCSPHIGHO2_01_FULL_38_45]OGC48647.1 MAG: hypothetical protein A3F07_01965 [candidate division WWE3 bacterium RIFCSPHIGHO2_12_FULL_38_15]OGC53053.1 MAG: hypothetical protein A3B64_01225 [candidate division WWE3 bacterium RIFCSPLOWO2_01_FULL_37_24]OGC53416.1 MAG: hypothetical protein A3D91_00080 [candidate division WWE3 bacterium RIFCSPHIGHO2_02_FULL_38_14]HLB51890.1 hypothetical protein [Patescibacteria group bacterium
MKSDLGQILKESYKITLKNKWLWVFGILLVGGSSFNFFSNSDFSDFSKKDEKEFKNISNSVYDIPGFPMSNDEETRLREIDDYLSKYSDDYEKNPFLDDSDFRGSSFSNELSNQMEIASLLAVTNVPKYYWMLLALAFGSFLFLMVVLGLYIKSWASCSLIKGIESTSLGVNIGIKEMSDLGRPHTVELIKLNIFSTLLAVFPIGLSILIIALSFALPPLTILLGLIGFIMLIASFIFMLLIYAGAVLGKVSMVLGGKKWKDAFIDGFNTAKKYILDVVVLGIVNCCIGCLVTCLSAIIVLPLVFAVIFGMMGAALVPSLIFLVLLIGGLVFVGIIVLFSAFGAVFAVFKQSTWVLMYKQLTQTIESNVIKEENTDGK